MKINVDNLREKLGPLVDSLGFELAELSAPVVGGRLILRAYIHSATGVTLDVARTGGVLAEARAVATGASGRLTAPPGRG